MTADLLHLFRWTPGGAPERTRVPEPGRGPVVVPYRSAVETASSTSEALMPYRPAASRSTTIRTAGSPAT